MFGFEAFSVEVVEPGHGATLLDYSSFELATSKAQAFQSRYDIVNIIEWEPSRKSVRNEWFTIPGRSPISYRPSPTIH
jgi:hypothetical protein